MMKLSRPNTHLLICILNAWQMKIKHSQRKYAYFLKTDCFGIAQDLHIFI